MFTFKISVPTDNTRELKKALAALTKKEILVGFPEEEERPRKEGEMNNAQLAFINDRGSMPQNIPPRPFMIPGIESVKDALEEHLTEAAVAALAGDSEGMNAGFQTTGMTAQMGIKNTITAGLEPPLSPVTLMLRRQRGLRGTKPLIATGQLVNAVTYVVRNRK